MKSKQRSLIVWSLTILLALTIASIHTFMRTATARQQSSLRSDSQSNGDAQSSITVHAKGHGAPLLNLQDGYEPGKHAASKNNATNETSGASLNAGSSQPSALASADFNEDGVPDLVTADKSGVLTLRTGNADSIYPNSREAQQRKVLGTFIDEPFLPNVQTFKVPAAPDMIFAGDFDADGHQDILAAADNSNFIYLLSGNGRGTFQAAQQIEVAGQVTALVAGQIGRADNLADVAVGIVTPDGARLLVYEHPEGAFKHAPEVFNLPAPATAIALGQLDADSMSDVAVACGNQLVVVHGHMQIYPWDLSPALHLQRPPAQVGQRTLGYDIAGVAAGKFTNSRRESLALLSTDGSIHLLEVPLTKRAPYRRGNHLSDATQKGLAVPSDGQFSAYKNLTASAPQFSSAAEAKKAGYLVTDGKQDAKEILESLMKGAEQKPVSQESTTAPPQVKEVKIPKSFYTAPSRIKEWRDSILISDARLSAAAGTGTRNLLTKARVSSTQTDDLVVLDNASRQIHIVSSQLSAIATQNQLDSKNTAQSIQGERTTSVNSLGVEGTPAAVLPVRLNTDALTDMVVLRSGEPSPSVVMTAPTNTFTVNSTADDVVSNCTDVSAVCTLRDAINRANNNPGSLIAFNIPGGGVQTISPFTQLPVVGQPVTIDGTTQPGYGGTPVIEIKGNNFPRNHGIDGLKIRASNCVIRGLAINEFPAALGGGSIVGGNGLTLESLSNQNNGHNLVEGNFLGTGPSGTSARGNTAANLNIFDSDNNTIGGTSALARNVMSGDGSVNTGYGIQLLGNNNLIEGNFVGTDATGNQKLSNTRGMLMLGSNNLIGGDAVGAGNVISGNGVLIPNTGQCGGGGIVEGLLFREDDPNTNLTLNNLIKGNKIGTNASGTAPLGNCYAGIGTLPPTQLIIGSITSGGRNIISNNGYGAIDIEAERRTDQPAGFTAISGDNIGTDITGTVAMPNTLGNQPGGFNVGYGVITVRPNTGSFVNVGSPGGTTPGGSCTGFCTLVSGNFDNNNGTIAAVFRDKGGEFGIFSSFVGTDISGTAPLPNYLGVVAVGETSYIGFPGIASGNLLSGNGIFGVAVGPQYGFTDYVAGNLIGTDTTGNNALPNNSDPLPFGSAVEASSISGSGGIVIGGTNASDRNIISGNILGALDISGDVTVQNNYIGVNQSGAALPNTGDGITSNGFVQIGGGNANQANLISNNGKTGILVKGGAADVRGNTITNNGKAGVSVIGGGSSANIRGNVIANNGDLGIDLGADGVTQNDCDDSDTGPNSLQNYPLLNTPTNNGNGSFNVHGTIKSTPHTTFTIDFYTNAAADPSMYGEGETYAGALSVTTSPYGIAEFDFASPNISAGQVITATATNPDLQTSEFSCGAGLCQQNAINRLRVSNAPIGCVDPIIVNTTGDEDDGDANDGVCDVDPNQTGNQCTLRAAIEEADRRGGGAFVAFDIPGGGAQTISPMTPLPSITAKARIDATTQSGYTDAPLIELNGSNAGNTFGLDIESGADNVHIRGFSIHHFGVGVVIGAGSNNAVEACYIGADPSGNPQGNGTGGIAIFHSSANTIGGPDPDDRNVILASGQDGVYIAPSSPSNKVIGNVIGINRNFQSSNTNQPYGIRIGSSNNIIGGSTSTPGTAPGNVICSNSTAGIFIQGDSSNSADNNAVAGNLIGITPNGVSSPNATNVLIGGNANNNTIGGTTIQSRNVISGASIIGVAIKPLIVSGPYPSNNKVQGNFIGTALDGDNRVSFTLPNQQIGVAITDSSNNLIGGSTSGARNVISGNDGIGVVIANSDPSVDQAHDNTVSGNYLGIGQSGQAPAVGQIPVFNGIAGITLGGQNVRNNTIGGFTVGARNVISGNLNTQHTFSGAPGNQSGIGILFSDSTHDNRIAGNYIGTDATGKDDVANLGGIFLRTGAHSNIIGGTTTGSRNIISGSDSLGGITIGLGDSSNTPPTSNNQVLGNYIGTDNTGTSALDTKNRPYGVAILDGATNNHVGSSAPGARNIISGNDGDGISIGESGLFANGTNRTTPPTSNFVQGNFIGADSSGNKALPNSAWGIALVGAQTTTIGGTAKGEGNIISGNTADGVEITDQDSQLNLVQGNFIGTQSNGTGALGNQISGVFIDKGASKNTIGGTAAGAGNVIMFNVHDGVSLSPSAGTGNMIDPNTISANAMLGISLDNSDTPTPNDPGDGDSGPNNLQNYPEFTSAVINASGNLVLQYKVDSDPNGNSNYGTDGLYVEFFKADATLQGQTFLGSANYAASHYQNGTPGLATFVAGNAAALGIAPGDKIVATATDADGNTSEFTSVNVGIVTSPPPPPPPTSAGNLIISEFRLRGPNGINDEFIELYNTTLSPITVNAADGSAGFAVAASDNVVRCLIPNSTIIPSGGHYLCANSNGYSLGTYPAATPVSSDQNSALGAPAQSSSTVAPSRGLRRPPTNVNAGPATATPNATYTTDIADNAGLALFNTAMPANFSMTTRLDAVGSTSETNTLYKEGTGYAALDVASLGTMEHSLYRDLCNPGANNRCTAATGDTNNYGGGAGRPKDTGNNASDFLFVNTTGTGAGARLGAPGPENLSSPIQRNTTFTENLLDQTKVNSAAPNRVRNFTSETANNSTFGTLSIRRRYTNNTGAPVTTLRFRAVYLTTYPAASSGTADLRARTSTNVTVSGIMDAATCTAAGAGAAPCAVTVQGTTLQQPPTQSNGGGWNSSLSVAIPGGTLANGASVEVQFLLGVQQTGSFRFYINIEALP